MDAFVTSIADVFALGPVAAMIGATILGVVVGALPGLNPVMAIALLLPLTYGMDPLVALAMVAGIYNGSMYGGAIPAILLRIPGTPASVATTFDGFPMAAKGQASKALKIACWSSAIGGMVSAIALITMGPMLAQVTLAFGPAEYFWVAVFGMVSVGVMIGEDMIKGLISATLGLLLGTIGIDMLSGQARFTFGEPWLMSGLNLIVVLVGLYAMPSVIELAEKADLKGMSRDQLRLDSVTLGWRAFRDHGRTWLRSSAIGICVGLLPGAGGSIASFLSYNAARSASKDPDSFGKGNPDGVAAAECGNNADNAAAMIPALTLGIPGNVIAALVLGALLIQGIQPGPQLYHQNAGLVFGFATEMFLTSALLFAVGGMAATRIFSQVQRLPGVIMVPMIFVLMSVGAFVINGRTVDLWVMFGFGLFGYVLEKIKVPLAPIVLGLILGPLAEQNVRRAMLTARGDWTELFTRPISAGIAIATLLVILFPMMKALRKRLSSAPQ